MVIVMVMVMVMTIVAVMTVYTIRRREKQEILMAITSTFHQTFH